MIVVRGSLKLGIKPFPSGKASAGRHDQHEGKTEDECVSPSHNGGYEYSRIVPKIRRFQGWSNGVVKWGGQMGRSHTFFVMESNYRNM